MAITRAELEKIYRELEGPLFNFALRWVFDRARAEDLVHEAFVRVWRRRDEVELLTIKSLLYKTIQNLALNEIRRRRVRDAFAGLFALSSEQSRKPITQAPPGALATAGGATSRTAEELLIENEELSTLRAALESLPLDFREALLLSQFSDMTHAQIAVTLGIAEGTVASRRNRALTLLRERFTVERSPSRASVSSYMSSTSSGSSRSPEDLSIDKKGKS